MDIKEILATIQKKPVSLFYGAGVCRDIGGPSGDQLFDSVKQQFSGGASKDFFSYMNEVIEFDNSNRNEIEKSITNQLSSVSPDDEHRYLFSLPWRAILTTNYDRLPNLIQKTLDGRRLVIPVINPDTDYPDDPTRPDLLFCFKLLGDIDYTFPKGGWMVLSSNDLKLAFHRRSLFFEMFHSLSSSGHIVYLGYSFRDNLVFDLLIEMSFVLKSIPWKGFAITKTQPSQEALKRMEKIGITWVEGSLKDFVEAAKDSFGKTPVSAPSIVSQFVVHNIPMMLERATAGNIWGKFKVFDVTYLEPFSKEPKYFLEGVDRSFYPFVAGWDFPRKTKLLWQNKENPQTRGFDFANFVKNRSKDGNSSNNIVVSLVGSAGSGKTVLSNRIAFDWYRTGNPVIFINKENLSIDSSAFDALLDEIWKNYQEALRTQERVSQPKPLRFLLIADDCGYLLSQLLELNNHLKSIGKPADILLVSRISDVPIPKLVDSKVDIIVQIDDTILKEEWAEFIGHFEDLNVIERDLLISNLQNPEINSSFFALVYTSVRGVQKPLKNIIIDEFSSLDADSQRVYGLVSLLQSQMLTPWVSLTTKGVKIGYDWLASQIEKGRLGGVLRFEQGQNAIFATNRVVADIVSDFVYKRVDQLFPVLRELVRAVTPLNLLEMQFLHLLLIERLESVLGTRLRNEQKIELFKDGIERVRSRPLLLHLAMLQIQSEKYEEASSTLKEALEAHVRGFGEPDQHVIDVKGRLELRLAERALKEGSTSSAWNSLDNAEACFKEAQISPSITPHSYQGLGKTYVEKAKLAPDRRTRWLYLLLAMQECAYVESYLGGEINPGVTALKNEVLALLQSESLDMIKIQQITTHIGKGNGLAFLAEQEIRRRDLESALAIVGKGLAVDPTNLWLIRLHVKLLRKISPDDSESLREALGDYVKIADRRFDVELSFELAMERFKNEDFRTAMRLFRELEERTKNHPHRLTQKPENRWMEKGRPKEFLGVIVDPPRFGKYGTIECTSLPTFRGTMPARAQDIDFPYIGGEKVSFAIIFNMVGPQASRVRKVAF